MANKFAHVDGLPADLISSGELYTLGEAATLSIYAGKDRLSVAALRQWVVAGKVKALPWGRTWLIQGSELLRLLREGVTDGA